VQSIEHYNIFQECNEIIVASNTHNEGTSGSHFTVSMGEDNKPTMEWVVTRNKKKPCHSSITLSFCCNTILPLVHGPILYGFTEHKTTN